MSIPDPIYVGTEDEAERWVDHFLSTYQANGGLGLDSETTGLNRMRDVIIYWSISDGVSRLALPASLLHVFKEDILENPNIDLDFTNARFDAHMFANMGIDLTKAGKWRDTVVQSWLINENNQGRHGLKECISDHFGRVTPTFEQTFGKVPPKKIDKITGRNVNKTMDQMIREAIENPSSDRFYSAVDYASLDAYNSTKLRQHFDHLLAQVPVGWGSLRDYFYAVEVPFSKVLYKMERRGIAVDIGMLQDKKGPMEKDMASIERDFAQAAGELVNLNSPTAVRKFFFDVLKKTPTKYTSGGASGNKQPSTDAEVLEDWAGQGDIWAQKLLKHRKTAKIYGTYVTGLMDHVDFPRDWRIHTSLNQTGTVTGRLSSNGPNLQNIPRPGEDVFKIREAFIPDQGRILIVADYAQLEMRLMAHFSGDDKMIKAIWDNVDLHCLTVSEMHGIPYDEVVGAVKNEKKHKKGELGRSLTPREEELLLMRQNAKATGFGIIYGIGGPRLAAQLTQDTGHLVTEPEGWMLIEKWLNVFPGVRNYIEHTKSELSRIGQVQTILGRWRRFGDVRGMSRRDASQAERQGVNSIIQGTAADVAKAAMLQCEDDEELKALGVTMLLQIHDELIFECPYVDDVIPRAKARVKALMESPFPQALRVPLPAEVGHGDSWATAK
jgi:DNA polymerase-1